jgi:hypothetical protein
MSIGPISNRTASLTIQRRSPAHPRVHERSLTLVNLDNHILQALQTRAGNSRPMTIGDLARQLGVSPLVVITAAHRLVDSGLAAPAMASVHGVPTLRGLSPLPSATSHQNRTNGMDAAAAAKTAD